MLMHAPSATATPSHAHTTRREERPQQPRTSQPPPPRMHTMTGHRTLSMPLPLPLPPPPPPAVPPCPAPVTAAASSSMVRSLSSRVPLLPSASPSASVGWPSSPRDDDDDADEDEWGDVTSPSPFAVAAASSSFFGRGSASSSASAASPSWLRSRSLRAICVCVLVGVWLLWSVLSPTPGLIQSQQPLQTMHTPRADEPQRQMTQQPQQQPQPQNTRPPLSSTTTPSATAEPDPSEPEQLSLVQLPLRSSLSGLRSSAHDDESRSAADAPPSPALLRSLRGQVYESAEAIGICALRPTAKEVDDGTCKAAAMLWARTRGSQRSTLPAAIADASFVVSGSAAMAEDDSPALLPLALPSCFVQAGVQGMGAFREAVAPSLRGIDADAGASADTDTVASSALLRFDRVDYASGTLLGTKDQGAVSPRPFLSYAEMRQRMMRLADQQTGNDPTHASAASTSSSPSPSSSSPIRVLFVTDELSDSGLSMSRLPYGGAGTAIYLLARALASASASPAAASSSAPSSPSSGAAPVPSPVARFDVHILHVTLHTLSASEQSTAVSTLASVGITLHMLPAFIHSMRQENFYSARTSYAVLLFLMQFESGSGGYRPPGASGSTIATDALGPPFHVVHMSDFNGFAYHSLQARRQGWAFARTAFVLTCHGSSSWAKAANEAYPRATEELETAFMERRSIEGAQLVISPSNYMLHWMRARNWQLPALTAVIPNMQPDAADTTREAKAVHAQSGQKERKTDATAIAAATDPDPACEIVFFGRLEHRKGLSLFLDAMDRLVEDGVAAAAAAGDSTTTAQQRPPTLRRFRLTFLGRELRDGVTGIGAHELIRTRASRWRNVAAASPSSVPLLRFISDASRTFALAYLSAVGSGRVAVMASPMDNSPYVVVECLQARVPFLATKVGGIPELIHKNDREQVLYEPNAKALAGKLRGILSVQRTGDAATTPIASTRPQPALPPFEPFVARGAHQSSEIAAQWVTLHSDLAAALGHFAAAPVAATSGSTPASTTAAAAAAAPVRAIPQIARALFVPPTPRELTSGVSRDLSRLPLVSVCVTHYHRPALLLHTLEALVAQSYPSSRLQVVIVDDGSTDPSTLSVLQERVEPFVAAQGSSWSLHRIRNSYLGSARNQCRGWMRGDFLLFLDDDDVPVRQMIAHLVQVALHTGAQLVATHFQLFWGKRAPKQIFHTQHNSDGSDQANSAQRNEGSKDKQDDGQDDDAESSPSGSDAAAASVSASSVAFSLRGAGWPLFPLSDGRLNSLNRAPPALFGFVGSSLSLTFFSNTAGGANVFIRSCVFDALGGFSEYREVGFEDYELHVNAAVHRVHAEVIPAPLLMVRRHLKPRASANAKDGPQTAASMQSTTLPHLNRMRVITRFLDSFSHADAAVDLAPLLQIAWGMHDAQLRSSAGASRAPSVSALPLAVELADSQRQFSGVQGQFGWWYALLILEGDSTAAAFNPNLLRRPLQSHDQLDEEAEWAASGQAGDAPKLQPPSFFSASYLSLPFPHWGCASHARSLCPPMLRDPAAQTWPHHLPTSVHPAIAGVGPGGNPLSVHTVRRWVSSYRGSATLRVSMQSEARHCGHGVVYTLYIERNRIFRHDEQNAQKHSGGAATHADSGPSGTVVDVTLDGDSTVTGSSGPHCSLLHHELTCVGVLLRVGSEVDLIVSPGINDWCDATNLIINIHTAT